MAFPRLFVPNVLLLKSSPKARRNRTPNEAQSPQDSSVIAWPLIVKSTPKSPHEAPSDHETVNDLSVAKSCTFTKYDSPSSSFESPHSLKPFCNLVLISGFSDSSVCKMDSSSALVGSVNLGSNDKSFVPRYLHSHPPNS